MVHSVMPDEVIADYARGDASPGLSLLVAAQSTLDPATRRRVAAYEGLGGALIAAEDPQPLGDAVFERLLARLDEAEGVAPEPPAADEIAPLPRPVLEALGPSARWRFRMPGVAEAELAGGEGEQVSVLRARPGVRIPQHTHKGREFTLVLAGALRDGEDIYRPGDLEIADAADDHRPEVHGRETCYCLIVLEGGLHFTGRFSRALNLFQR